MFTTVVVVLCKLVVAHATIAPDRDCTAEEMRNEEIVTDSSMDDKVTFQSCMIHGQLGVAEWMGKHPTYARPGWRVGRVKCVPGRYTIPHAV